MIDSGPGITTTVSPAPGRVSYSVEVRAHHVVALRAPIQQAQPSPNTKRGDASRPHHWGTSRRRQIRGLR